MQYALSRAFMAVSSVAVLATVPLHWARAAAEGAAADSNVQYAHRERSVTLAGKLGVAGVFVANGPLTVKDRLGARLISGSMQTESRLEPGRSTTQAAS